MRERCDQHPKQRARFAAVCPALPCFDGGANMLIQDLRIGLDRVQKGRDRFGVSQQPLTPLFCLVQHALLLGTTVQKCFQLLSNQARLNVAHHFADKLQLSTPGFMIFRGKAAVCDQCFAELLGVQLQSFKLAVWQFHKLCTQGLQRMHVTFSSAFRRTFVLVKSGFMVI